MSIEEDKARLAMLEDKQRLAQLEAQQAASAAPPQKEKEAWYQDFGEGIGSAGINTYYGAKSLFKDLTEEEKATIADWEEDAGESGWGTGGRIVGELGMLMAPGGLLGAGAKAATKIPKLARGLQAASNATRTLKADVGLSAGHGALTLPGEGQDRLSNALLSGGGAAVGGGLAKVIGKVPLLKGVDKTPVAQAQLDEGIPLLAGQASVSSLPKALDYVASFLPTTAKGMREMREAGLEKWNKVTFDKVRPPGSKKITQSGHAGMRQLKQRYDDAYDAAWGKATKPDDETFEAIYAAAGEAGSTLAGTAPAAANKVMTDLVALSENYTSKGIKSFDNMLRKRIESAYKGNEIDLGEALKKMRDTLKGSLGPDVMEDLATVDTNYGAYLGVKHAAGSSQALDVKGVIEPKNLKAGIKKAGKGRESFGTAPGQPWLDASMETIGRKEPNPIIDMLKGVAGNIWSPTGALDVTRRGMLGELPWQPGAQATADALRANPYLPSFGKISGAVVGG